ncbi:monooxygenase [Streptomyces sp. NBC_00287]|uniref:NAD(P)/FAD-dependent oxidoreductase n=1 Tax=Streptomyces sp. NBC_00287 TaxID=2975702 RepID=UPI002E29426B|nr:FAD-dependent oxidoreductase [Streptomyces sp. NBC_00287]
MADASRALVVGGGYAGLVTARVLADRFDEVTIVERDGITDRSGPAHRRGTPQSHHPHGMLARGARTLEELFPGLRNELAKEGAPLTDFGCLPMLYPAGWSPSVPTGLATQTYSRPLLEAALRRRVLALGTVTVLDGTRVEGLVREGRVTGVRTDVHGVRTADLVVIATGRHGRALTWLMEIGVPRPAVLAVDGRLSYASRPYRRDPVDRPDLRTSIQATLAPTARRGGVVVAIEDDRWLVCLFGADGETAPTDPEGFADYAASLANPYIRTAVRDCEPLGPVHRYGGLGGEWYRYDRVRPWPGGVVVLGDALCGLNPLYGHGMTVAAVQARLLGRTLDRHAPDRACALFQRRVARTLLLPWYLSTSLDQGWRTDRVPVTAALARRCLDRVLGRIPSDPELYRRFLHVQHMVASPLTLLAPAARRRPRGARP